MVSREPTVQVWFWRMRSDCTNPLIRVHHPMEAATSMGLLR